MQVERAMRPLSVVVVDEDPEHPLEVAPVENQQPVQTLSTHRADEAFRERVCLWCPHRRLHDPDAFAAEDLVEGAAVLAVAVADQEAHPGLARDEEEHVEATQQDRLDSEEIAGD